MFIIETVMFTDDMAVKVRNNRFNEFRILLFGQSSKLFPLFFVFKSFLGIIIKEGNERTSLLGKSLFIRLVINFL